MVRAARLRRSREIAIVRSEGRAVRRSSFLARARASGTGDTRIAVTAARTIGTAVTRNRARRRVREAFRRELAAMNAASVDILVSVRPEAVAAPFASLVSDASSALREVTR